MKCTCKSK